MTRRIAAILALIAFAMCLVEGLRAENSFTTVVLRALLALAVTFVVGLVIGAMAEAAIRENVAQTEEPEKSANLTDGSNR